MFKRRNSSPTDFWDSILYMWECSKDYYPNMECHHRNMYGDHNLLMDGCRLGALGKTVQQTHNMDIDMPYEKNLYHAPKHSDLTMSMKPY